ncbi:MAG: hypothetical protein ACTSXZ_10185 [Alphaproteobacteria bacterium]
MVLDRLDDFARAFGLRQVEIEVAARIYRRTLAEYPAWALERAVARLEGDWKWPSAPKPADVKAALPGEYHRLVVDRMRLQTARATAAKRREPVLGPPADDDAMRRLAEELQQKPKRMPVVPLGKIEPEEATRDERRRAEEQLVQDKARTAKMMRAAGFEDPATKGEAGDNGDDS